MLHLDPGRNIHLGPLPNHDLAHKAKIKVQNVSFWYGLKQALKNVSLNIYANEVTAFIGPSGCGKSTFLRCLNRTNEIVSHTRMDGLVLLDGLDVYDPALDPPLVRRRLGWIAQRPNPFARSIRDNILYGPQIHGFVSGREYEDALVEFSLRAVGLWDEVCDRLDHPGDAISIGQQQRLCIARAIAIQPEVMLMDEPCSALDPVATALIERLIDKLRATYTIVIITHNMQQGARISQRIAFFHLGEILETGDTEQVFGSPKSGQSEDFMSGLYG